MASQARSSRPFADPAPTVSLDDVNDGEYTPVQKNQLDLSCMVDRAYSMAEWSMNQSVASGPHASPEHIMPGPTSSMIDAEGYDSTAADLAALDSMYTALSSFGFNQDVHLRQSDSLVGSVHTTPSPASHRSPIPSNDAMDPGINAGLHHNLQDHFNAAFTDDFDHAQPGSHSVPGLQHHASAVQHSKSMAAARSALIEMQSQGLTYQNIQELVQNIQDLLNCLRDRHNVGNIVNQVQINERLRQAVLHMISSGGPHAAYDASMLFAAAATGAASPPMAPPHDASEHSPHLRPSQPTTPHPLTPNHSGMSGPPRSLNRCQTPPRRAHHHPAHDNPRIYPPYMTPSASSMHTPSYTPDLSPPPTPGVFSTGPNLTPRNHDRRGGHSGTLPNVRGHAASPAPYSGRRASHGQQAPPPQQPEVSDTDSTPVRLSRKPSFKVSALQSMYDDKAASEPLPGHKGGTGVFIPGLHRQPLNVNPGAGVSGPLGAAGGVGGGCGNSGRTPLSAPLSDVNCSMSAGTFDVNEAQTSPDSLAGSTELPQARSARLSEARSTPKAPDRCANPRAPPPLGYPSAGPPGSLNVDSAYSGSLVDPQAYSGSFYTQELMDDDESRDLSGSGPFRHMSFHTYGGGEMSRTLFSKESGGSGGRGGVLPRCGDDLSPHPPHLRSLRHNNSGRMGGLSAPIPESTPCEEPEEHLSLSASLSPHSGSLEGIAGQTRSPPAPMAARHRGTPSESLTDALGHLSIPGDGPPLVSVSGGSLAAAAAYRRAMRASAASIAPPMHQQPPPPHLAHSGRQATQYSSVSPPPRADARGVPAASECIPLTVAQWSQDHTSVTIFLELEKFNPASLMVQIQQHMVVVMALNTDAPSHVFMMRPEHAVRVQGSKSRPQPGNGIHIILQKRSPGNTWSTYGAPMGPTQ